ncbi:hypothetical protein HYS47_00150 [Candidatus Woesearchaeota archaeon]|nr:hypothetical protein [Candidatus Woesearchaeota archaeon]
MTYPTIYSTLRELEDALPAMLGIERLFSKDHQFQKQDGTVVQPTAVPHGMIELRVFSRWRAYEHPHGYEIHDQTLRSIGANIADTQANAAEIGGFRGDSFPIQLYKI